MTQKEKGYVGLGVMLVLAAGTVFGSDPLYKAIDAMSAEKVDYTPGTYVGSAQGFGGEVIATVTVGSAGIENVELAGAGETPALGGAALEQLGAAFVEANSSKVDVVAGASISSNAAMEAVQQALDQASGKIDVIERTEDDKEAPKENIIERAEADYKPGTYEGTAKGYGGEVKAKVVIGNNGIESVELTGEGETPAIGGEALKKLPEMFVAANSAGIDGVTGATFSSNAAKEAVQKALDQAEGKGAAPAADEKKTEPAKEESASKAPASNISYKPGTYEGTAKGYGGEVKAKVVIGNNGIESVELTGEGETPAIGGEALKKLPEMFVAANSAGIDGVTGATLSSNAAKEAVQKALEQAEEGEASASDKKETEPAEEASASKTSDSNISYKPGTYVGTAKGFGDEVKAEVVIGDNGIESVKLTGDKETPEVGGEALKALESVFEKEGSADIDGVTGATVSSDAAKKAVQAALDQAK